MGSFSSKMRSSSADSNGNSSQKSKADPGFSGIAENTTPQTLEAAANEDKAKAGSTSQEQPSETKTAGSFSWLASTPVEYDPKMKKSKEKGKRPTTEGGEKTMNIAKYSNEKYLTSVEMPSTSKTEPKLNASYPSCSSENYGENDEDRRRHRNQNSETVSPTCSGVAYPIGFGVAGKKDSTIKSWSTDGNASMHSRDSKGEGRNRHPRDETGR